MSRGRALFHPDVITVPSPVSLVPAAPYYAAMVPTAHDSPRAFAPQPCTDSSGCKPAQFPESTLARDAFCVR